MTPGKWAEKKVQGWLNDRSGSDLAFAWHRFPDSHAARNALSPSPADYLVAYRGKGYLLEVKETAQLKRLPRAKIRQYGKLNLFNEAGFHTYVLVYMSESKCWTYLASRQLFLPGGCPASFPLSQPHYPSENELLKEIFG